MSDLGDLLREEMSKLTPSPRAYERILRRAGRRQRNRRLGAGLLAMAVSVAAAGGLWAAFRPTTKHVPVTPLRLVETARIRVGGVPSSGAVGGTGARGFAAT